MKVLISPGYGAGFSTWNIKEMAIDKDLIALVERGCTYEEMEEACRLKWYNAGDGDAPYMGGFDDLEIVEVPNGALFRIREYDGSEYIEIFNSSNWILAED